MGAAKKLSLATQWPSPCYYTTRPHGLQLVVCPRAACGDRAGCTPPQAPYMGPGAAEPAACVMIWAAHYAWAGQGQGTCSGPGRITWQVRHGPQAIFCPPLKKKPNHSLILCWFFRAREIFFPQVIQSDSTLQNHEQELVVLLCLDWLYIHRNTQGN